MKVLGKRCLIEMKTVERELGGIFIPEDVKAGKDIELYIHSLGPDVDNADLKIGQRVIVEMKKSVSIKIEDTDYLSVDQDDIVIILKDVDEV